MWSRGVREVDVCVCVCGTGGGRCGEAVVYEGEVCVGQGWQTLCICNTRDGHVSCIDVHGKGQAMANIVNIYIYI